MKPKIEELAWGETPMGEISLRRRLEPTLLVDVYEVKLGDEFLMSSLFTDSEVALARLAWPRPGPGRTGLDVLVGGLGLGCTARTVLEDDRVGSLVVVDALAEVIDWHQRRCCPAAGLTADPRTRLVAGRLLRPRRRRAAGPGAPGAGSTRSSSTSTTRPAPAAPQPRRLLLPRRAAPAAGALCTRRRVRAVVGRPARRGLPGGARQVFDRSRPRRELHELPHRRGVGLHGVRGPMRGGPVGTGTTGPALARPSRPSQALPRPD